jgi:hypothetical protein
MNNAVLEAYFSAWGGPPRGFDATGQKARLSVGWLKPPFHLCVVAARVWGPVLTHPSTHSEDKPQWVLRVLIESWSVFAEPALIRQNDAF